MGLEFYECESARCRWANDTQRYIEEAEEGNCKGKTDGSPEFSPLRETHCSVLAAATRAMQHIWLYSVCQCVLYVSVIVVSVRMCAGRAQRSRGGGVSDGLRTCLGWTGAAGSAATIPVSVLLNLRSPRCLYTCLTLVCCPLLVRQFTMCLLLLLALDSHLQYRLGERYVLLVSRRRALLVVLLSWVGSVLAAFAQFIGWNVLDTWGRSPGTGGTAGLGLGEAAAGGNWTTPPLPPPRYPGPQDRSVIGQHLPYGGFLSKFYAEDLRNFTYAEIHGSHWGVCALDTALSPRFLVYVYGVTAFLFPLLALLALYLDLLCAAPEPAPRLSPQAPKSQQAAGPRALALSLSLLVLLCLPFHTSNALLLFSPGTPQPSWVPAFAYFLFQLYGLVPPLLHTPSLRRDRAPHAPRPLPPSSPLSVSLGKHFGVTLCSDVRACGICCPPRGKRKVKVCPQV